MLVRLLVLTVNLTQPRIAWEASAKEGLSKPGWPGHMSVENCLDYIN